MFIFLYTLSALATMVFLFWQTYGQDDLFDAKSASFYVDLDTMAFLMGQKEVVLVHVNNKTEESRTIIMSGQKKIYSALEYRKIKGEKPYLVFRC